MANEGIGGSLEVPTLTTQRLTLEPLSMAHSQGMFDLWSEGAVCKFSGVVKDHDGVIIETPVTSPVESDRIIDFWVRAAADGWGFRWAVMLQDSAEPFTGIVGFNTLEDCSEIAFHLLPKHWGKGLMTEASQAAIDWRRDTGASEIEAFIEPENGASIALVTRLGLSATEDYSDGAQRYCMTI